MNQQNLLKEISQAILREEEAVPIYAQHISTTTYWAGMPEEKAQKIRGYLKILHDDSLAHIKAFSVVKKILNKK